jgi:HAD superfamily hydrolase (TIGR01662 family)
MMMLYMFDIDGTLIRSFMCEGGGGQSQDYDLVEFLPKRLAKLSTLARDPNSAFALITNQAGVAFGYQTKEQVLSRLFVILRELDFLGCVSVHVSYFHPKATVTQFKGIERYEGIAQSHGADAHDRRKPGAGMLFEALDKHEVWSHDAVFVGDMDTDRQAALVAGVKYVDAQEFFA